MVGDRDLVTNWTNCRTHCLVQSNAQRGKEEAERGLSGAAAPSSLERSLMLHLNLLTETAPTDRIRATRYYEILPAQLAEYLIAQKRLGMTDKLHE